MRQLLYIIFILTFIGCVDNNQPANNSNLTDTAKTFKKVINEPQTPEIEQSDYKILPVDESKSDSSLVVFIDYLRKVVSDKDTAGLFESLDTAIVVSHGGGVYGISEFSNRWNLNQPDNSELWTLLDTLLSMGGTWEGDNNRYFSIPYTHSNKLLSKFKYDFDYYFTAVCISDETMVYEKPSISSESFDTLNYEIVEMDYNYMKEDFTKIQTIGKKIKGYVKTSDIVLLADHSLVIKKIESTWKIIEFAPFD
jgi:hypothetical protein